MDPLTLGLLGTGIAFLICLVLGVHQTITAPASPTAARLETYIAQRRRPVDQFLPGEEEEEKEIRRGRRAKSADFLPWLTRLIKRKNSRFLNNLSANLARINSSWRASEVIYAAVMLGLVVFLIGLWVIKNFLFSAALGGVAGFIPFWIVGFKAKKWMRTFERQLADTLMVMANAMRAGYGFLQAMEMISREGMPPMSEEFAKMLYEISLGKDVERALEDMAGRIQSPDLDIVVTSILIARSVGGALAEILMTISETIRERVRIRGEIAVLTAQGKLTGALLSLLPVFMGVVLSFVGKDPDDTTGYGASYIAPLFKVNPNASIPNLGHYLLAYCLFSQALGYYIITRIVSIEI